VKHPIIAIIKEKKTSTCIAAGESVLSHSSRTRRDSRSHATRLFVAPIRVLRVSTSTARCHHEMSTRLSSFQVSGPHFSHTAKKAPFFSDAEAKKAHRPSEERPGRGLGPPCIPYHLSDPFRFSSRAYVLHAFLCWWTQEEEEEGTRRTPWRVTPSCCTFG
jgi:hypothetical protein